MGGVAAKRVVFSQAGRRRCQKGETGREAVLFFIDPLVSHNMMDAKKADYN
jgi:hypothetical protein